MLDPKQQELWEEAREYAAAEILAKYRYELKETHFKQFSRLTQARNLPCPACHGEKEGSCA